MNNTRYFIARFPSHKNGKFTNENLTVESILNMVSLESVVVKDAHTICMTMANGDIYNVTAYPSPMYAIGDNYEWVRKIHEKLEDASNVNGADDSEDEEDEEDERLELELIEELESYPYESPQEFDYPMP